MNVTFRMSLAKSIMKYIVTYAKREPFKRMTLDEIRRRPTLPGRFQPSTISVLRLNFCVRDGNRWIPQAIVTGNMGLSRWDALASPSLAFWLHFALSRCARFASLRISSFDLLSCASLPRTLKTAQVRFRFPSPDQGALPLLASTFFFPQNHLPRSQVSLSGLCFALAPLFPNPYSLIPLSKIKPSTD